MSTNDHNQLLQIESELKTETDIGTDHVVMELVNRNNYGYIGEFFLGSIDETTGEGSLQSIRILLDTGSANSWIMSDQSLPTTFDPDTDEAHVFDPEESCGGTFNEPDDDHKQHVKITFGSGYLKGYFVEDRCTIGNPDVDASDSERLVIEQYTFGMVTEQTCFHDTFDAIVGLAYPEFAEPGVEPFFDAMMAEGILGYDVFAFHMSMNPDDEESEVMFGDWNVDKIDPTYNDGTGALDWHPV